MLCRRTKCPCTCAAHVARSMCARGMQRPGLRWEPTTVRWGMTAPRELILCKSCLARVSGVLGGCRGRIISPRACRKATSLDPRFAPAWLGLGHAAAAAHEHAQVCSVRRAAGDESRCTGLRRRYMHIVSRRAAHRAVTFPCCALESRSVHTYVSCVVRPLYCELPTGCTRRECGGWRGLCHACKGTLRGEELRWLCSASNGASRCALWAGGPSSVS